MNHTDEAKLRTLLRAAGPAHELPTGFNSAVWRRIEHEERHAGFSFMETVALWIRRPRWALSGLAAVMVLGAALGALSGGTQVKDSARERYVTSVDPFQKTH